MGLLTAYLYFDWILDKIERGFALAVYGAASAAVISRLCRVVFVFNSVWIDWTDGCLVVCAFYYILLIFVMFLMIKEFLFTICEFLATF